MDPGLFIGQVDNLSNLLHIKELRERLVEHLQSKPKRQIVYAAV